MGFFTLRTVSGVINGVTLSVEVDQMRNNISGVCDTDTVEIVYLVCIVEL